MRVGEISYGTKSHKAIMQFINKHNAQLTTVPEAMIAVGPKGNCLHITSINELDFGRGRKFPRTVVGLRNIVKKYNGSVIFNIIETTDGFLTSNLQDIDTYLGMSFVPGTSDGAYELICRAQNPRFVRNNPDLVIDNNAKELVIGPSINI